MGGERRLAAVSQKRSLPGLTFALCRISRALTVEPRVLAKQRIRDHAVALLLKRSIAELKCPDLGGDCPVDANARADWLRIPTANYTTFTY
jgi:hypothetical protein